MSTRPANTNSALPARRGALLDTTAAIALAGPILMLITGIDFRPFWLTLIVAAATALTVVGWVWWRCATLGIGRKVHPRVPALALAVSAIAVIVFGNGQLAFGTLWIGALALAHGFGSRVTIGYAAGMVAIVTIAHVATGSPLPKVLAEAAGVAVLAGFGVAFALVLRDAERVDAERLALLHERQVTLMALQRTNTKLERSNAELERRLGTEQDLVLAQERERTARELHDGLGHQLTAIGLSLEFAERTRTSDPRRSDEEVSRARIATSQALDTMRRVVRAMNPIETSTARGADAFETIASAFRSTGLDVRASVSETQRLSQEHTLLLLRFVQEGLTNVVRHTTADRVELRISSDAEEVSATLLDFGGSSVTSSFGGPGYGIRSLSARAEALGGTLSALPHKSGFALHITLPQQVPSFRDTEALEEATSHQTSTSPRDKAEAAA